MYTFDDYNRDILSKATQDFMVKQAASMLTQKNAFLDDYELQPLTRWQKFKHRMWDLKQRCKDIWTIVKGGDIHEDCGY